MSEYIGNFTNSFDTGDINDNTNSFNITTNSFNTTWNNSTISDNRPQLLDWLSPLDPSLRHSDIQERRVDNVGEWLLQTEEFRRWHSLHGEGERDNAVLFCYGDPGVGKTFISSLVVDRLCDQARGQKIAVTCFYFDFAAQKEHSATNMLGSLVKQMVTGMERIPEEISRAFQDQKKVIGGRGPQLADLVKMLQAITSSQRTFICIDALDECAAAQRVRLLDSLGQILARSPGTQIFMTGRPHILDEVGRRLSGRVASVSIGPTKGDITRYLRARLGEDEMPEAMDESLEAEILEKIPENISDMFLLVSLGIEAILQESTIRRRRDRLRKITAGSGVEGAYGATIARVKAQGGSRAELGMAALMWISHAERPLRANELCHALGIELGSTDFNGDNVPSISILVSSCQGLITVDKEGSTVRLIHFTLQEYLSASPDIFSTPHSVMAEMCLTYLNSQQVKALSADLCPNILNTSSLEYCSQYWGVHAKREPSDRARSLAVELLREYDGHISTRLLLGQVEHLNLWDFDTSSPFSGLHCASFFGIIDVVAALIELKCCDINNEDFWGHTPLAWAAHNGHDDTVKMLLGREEADPDKPDKYAKTPLSFAAWNGHEEVVKMLLGRQEVNPDKPDNDGHTPLLLAVWKGHEGVVKILLGRKEVNPDNPSNYGRTPLSYAAQDGHDGVVNILLGWEVVTPDKPDAYGKTPLSFAAQNGRERVVEILLGREMVDPDKADNYRRTPLFYATQNGHEGVVKILLARRVNPGTRDIEGQTPFMLAARYGHRRMIGLLQPRGVGTHRAI